MVHAERLAVLRGQQLRNIHNLSVMQLGYKLLYLV